MEALSKDEEVQLSECQKSGLSFLRSGRFKNKQFYDLKMHGKVIRYEVRKPFPLKTSGVFLVLAKVDEKQLASGLSAQSNSNHLSHFNMLRGVHPPTQQSSSQAMAAFKASEPTSW